MTDSKLTTAECIAWLDTRVNRRWAEAIKSKLLAAQEMAKALDAYTGGKPPKPIEYWTHHQCDEMARKALADWKDAGGE